MIPPCALARYGAVMESFGIRGICGFSSSDIFIEISKSVFTTEIPLWVK